MIGETRTEYGVLVAAGPHEGMLTKTFRTLEAAQRFIDEPAPSQRGKFYIRKRQVTVTDWELP